MALTPEKSTSTLERPITADLEKRRVSVCDESIDPSNAGGSIPVHAKTDKQIKSLNKAFKKIVLFQGLDSTETNEIINAMHLISFNAGSVVIKEGGDADFFYIVESGKFEARTANSKGTPVVTTYGPDDYFGELALMYSTPRAATVTAKSNGTLWALDRDTFKRIILSSAYKKRKSYETLIDSIPVFKKLKTEEKLKISDNLLTKHFENGNVIIKKDDNPDGIYFVLNKPVELRVDRGRGEQTTTLTMGDYFGEVAIVKNTKRSATVTSIGKSSFAFLAADKLETILAPALQDIANDVDKEKTSKKNIPQV